MPRRLTQRREPRVLVVLSARSGLRYAAVDLDEVRSTGSLPRLGGPSLATALRRLVAREHPSALSASSPALGETLRRAGHGLLPLLPWPARPLPPVSLRFLWPESEVLAPTADLERAVGAAAALLLDAPCSSRRYGRPQPTREGDSSPDPYAPPRPENRRGPPR